MVASSVRFSAIMLQTQRVTVRQSMMSQKRAILRDVPTSFFSMSLRHYKEYRDPAKTRANFWLSTREGFMTLSGFLCLVTILEIVTLL